MPRRPAAVEPERRLRLAGADAPRAPLARSEAASTDASATYPPPLRPRLPAPPPPAPPAAQPAPSAPAPAAVEREPVEPQPSASVPAPVEAEPAPRPTPPIAESVTPPDAAVAAVAAAPRAPGRAWTQPAAQPRDRSTPVADAPRTPVNGDDGALERGATAPQLRRFIKSRAYVPMHELRRRFAINGDDDDVTPVDLERRRIFVGLPEREGRLLGELLRGGDIGFELSLDPISPIVVGVYPMRPVTRG